MKKALARRKRDERGMTTAEYAVGTVATVTGVGALVALFNQPWFRDILKQVIDAIVQVLIQSIGGGGL
jgi:Flp pilus assembly pilin Flp